MLDNLSGESVLQTLRDALDASILPLAAQKQATKLVDRLTSGARIALLGPQGVGKSCLCDALMRSYAGPYEAGRLITNEPIGPTQADDLHLFPNGMSFERRTADGLGQVQLIDLAQGAIVKADVQHVISRADIVLWCTESFGPDEAEIWSKAPDALKDHSFLVLTKADQLARKGVLASRVDKLRAVAAEEFHGFFPTTTVQVCRALRANGSVIDEVYAASGVQALASTIKHLSESGLRADMDGALLFIERYGLQTQGNAAPSAPIAVSQEKSHAQVATPNFENARDYLRRRALDLAELSFDAESGDLSEVLHLCSEISEEVVEIITRDPASTPQERQWHSAFEEASDKVVLMAMENDPRSAADAVSILLQLRRDLDFLLVKAA